MRCYGNASKRKRLNTETDPKVTMGPFPFFYELSEIPQKLKSVEGFLNIFDRFPLYLHLIRFPYFLIGFHIFLGPCWGVSIAPYLQLLSLIFSEIQHLLKQWNYLTSFGRFYSGVMYTSDLFHGDSDVSVWCFIVDQIMHCTIYSTLYT